MQDLYGVVQERTVLVEGRLQANRQQKTLNSRHHFRPFLLFFFVFSYNFASTLVPFWCSLSTFWLLLVPLGSLLAPLGPLLAPLGPKSGKKQIWRRLGENSGSKSDFILSLIVNFFCKRPVMGCPFRRLFL